MVQTPKSEVTRAANGIRLIFLCIQLVSPNGPSGAAVVMRRGNKVTTREVSVVGGAH